MYAPLPRSYWVDTDTGEAHVVDSYGDPGPIVRKPLCEETEYQSFVEGEATVPAGVWVEGRNEQLETERFNGENPAEAIRREVCSACQERYLELLWRRPADYPAIEIAVETRAAAETYMVADCSFVTDDDHSPRVQLVDEIGRTKQMPMQQVKHVTPHAEMPVVY